jgi:hypothetical protein
LRVYACLAAVIPAGEGILVGVPLADGNPLRHLDSVGGDSVNKVNVTLALMVQTVELLECGRSCHLIKVQHQSCDCC